MRILSLNRTLLLLLLPIITTGCSTLSGWETRSASNSFVDGTVVLGEVIRITTREEALNKGGFFESYRENLIAAGYSDDDIVDGGQASIWTYCYAHNSGVDWCKHTGHYVAHIPSEFRKDLKSDMLNPHGDLVEVRLTRTEENYLVGEVIAIYRKSENWDNCRIATLTPRSALYSAASTLMLVGPPQGTWIECDMDVNDGWQRRPVNGAPLSADTPISEWVKYPG